MDIIPPHLAYVATLPCETLMSAKQATYSKLQGSLATYLRCGWGLLITKLKKVYCWVCECFFKLANIWQSYKQKRGCLMHFARLANTLLKDEESESVKIWQNYGHESRAPFYGPPFICQLVFAAILWVKLVTFMSLKYPLSVGWRSCGHFLKLTD